MGLDCRQWLEVKEYEFLLNWYIRQLQQHQLAELSEPFSYDGYSAYDQLFLQLVQAAKTAFVERFGLTPPQLVFTNLFHLAELELAGRRQPLAFSPPKQSM